MAKKERLKSGLDSLFEENTIFAQEGDGGEKVQASESGTQMMRISLIEPDRNQPRIDFDEEALNELADNIRMHGVLQPILVRPLKNGSYQIVAGERRWRASRIAGLTEIPVLVRDLTDMQSAQIALIENVQRADLNPIEESLAYKRLSEEFGMTQEQMAKTVGKSRSAIANSMRLLNLSAEVQQALAENQITVGHAKVLASVEDPSTQWVLLTQLQHDSMTVRQFEDHVDKVLNGYYKSNAQRKEILKQERLVKSKKGAFGDSFKGFAIATSASLKQEYGLETWITPKRDGTVKMEISFENEQEFRDALKRFTDRNEG